MKPYILLTLILAACGNGMDHETTTPKVVKTKTKTWPKCVEVDGNERLRFYEDDGSEVVRDVHIYECTLANKSWVRFAYESGWSWPQIEYEYISTWPTDHIPEYLDPNINCQIQTCSKE